MQTIFLDFETYYDDEYSLRKMTPVEYVLDPRFECNGCAVQEGLDGQPYWLDGDLLPGFFARLDPKVTMLVTHNALFDMCIVAWRYGFTPRLMVCTMSMARACLGAVLKSVSLAAVSDYFDLPAKGDVLHKVKGMNLAAIQFAGLYKEYVQYGLRDVSNCAGIYKKLVTTGMFPISELVVMDSVLRCAIAPQFKLNAELLAEHLQEVKAEKETLLARAMLVTGASGKADLMSNDKFAEMLIELGVDPPRKTSPVTGNEAWAFAKSDADFLELREHPSTAVQVLVEARLGHKSTLAESRAERFLDISRLTWPTYHQGNMPVPLRFSGAHTHRLSGDWSLNMQNLHRGTPDKPSKLRCALMAPPGHKVVAVDSSQVEARGVAVLSGQTDLVEAFAKGDDVYSNFASYVFNKPVNKNDNKTERFVGKQSILGLGYGLGAPKFRDRLKTDSINQTGTAIELTAEQAQFIVSAYREKYAAVPNAWKKLNYEGIPALMDGGFYEFGPCKFEKHAVLLPSGLKLFYHNLHRDGGEYWFQYGRFKKKLYGGKLLENITQALARIIVMDAALRIRKRTARSFALQGHDELVYIVPDSEAEDMQAICLEEMRRRPTWCPDWPLDAEAGVGQNYGEAK